MYKEIGCWKSEDTHMLAAPIEFFKQYFHDGKYWYYYIVSRKEGDIVGDQALKESEPRYLVVCI